MESRQVLATFAVGVVLLSAGCSGLLGGSESTATPANATTAVASPPLVTAGGTLDTAALLAMHNETVRSAGTFTRTTSVSGVFTTTMRADTDSGEAFATVESAADGTTDIYIDASGTQHIRQTDGSGTNYYVLAPESDEVPEDVRRLTADPDRNPISSGLVPYVTTVTWTFQGNTTDEGTTVMRFTANGADATSTYDASTISSFSAELLVEPGGSIRKLNTTVVQAGQDRGTKRLAVDIRYSKLGRTSVDAPAWLDTARTRADDA